MNNAILIAEDEPHIAESLTFLLQRAGFCVTVTGDGEACLKALRAGSYTLLVLDVMMPKINGFEVLKALRADPQTRAVRVLMLTAKGQESDRKLAMELGADHYISKPFSNQEVVSAVKSLTDTSQD